LVNVPSSGLNGTLTLTDETGQNGLYSLIVMTSQIVYLNESSGLWLSVMTTDQMNSIHAYQSNFNVRLVVLNDSPDASTGVVALTSAPWGTGIDQMITFDPNASYFADVAGLQMSLTASAKGLWHKPSKISNAAIAQPVLSFLPDSEGVFTNETVAAAVISMNGREQLSFYFAAGTWSSTTILFGQLWFTWGMQQPVNMIINGGFENSPKCASATAMSCQSTNTSLIAPWRVTSTHKIFEIDTRQKWSNYRGNWSMDLNSDKPYTIGQSVSTTVGQYYRLQFALTANAFALPVIKTGFVNMTGGSSSVSGNFTSGENGYQWKVMQYAFKASAASTLIELGSTTAGGFGPVIDSVQMVAITAPSASDIVLS
jgi:hypothetical protein